MGVCFFLYRPIRVLLDKWPLKGYVCFPEIWDLWAAGRTVPEDQAMTTVDKSTGNMDRIGRVDTQRKHKET